MRVRAHAREETRKSRGIIHLFLNTGRGQAGVLQNGIFAIFQGQKWLGGRVFHTISDLIFTPGGAAARDHPIG
jgi:hypothetical protein